MNIPYYSQWDADGSQRINDCGPACVKMVMAAHGIQSTINDISTAIMPTDSGTTAAQLTTALRKAGVKASVWYGTGYPQAPYIALVNYAGFARANVQDVNFRGWHWLVVLSMNDLTVVCNDPDYTGARRNEGSMKRYGRAEFDAAFVPYGGAKIAVTWPAAVASEATTMTTEYIVLGDGGVNVRRDASTSNTPYGMVLSGTHIKVESINSGWAKVLIQAGLAGIVDAQSNPVTGYMYAALLQEVVVPPTPPPAPAPITGKHSLGVNVIGQAQIAKELSGVGCRAFVIVDNPGACESIKAAHPDAVVVNRRWSNDPLNGQQQWDKFGASCNTGVINEIFNEADGSHSYGSVEQLRLRIDQEFQYADIARSKGALVALGCFSMGTPDFNNTAICEQMKRYAARYNSDPGIYFSLHNYSPNMTHIDDDSGLIWYETRFKFLFEKCGFNPALRKIIATETGVDEGGVGGFPAHHATSAQFTHWCERYQKIIANTQVIASMIFAFTAGRDAKWAGYDIAAWQGELAKAAGW